MAVVDTHAAHDDHHDHGEFIAHHFDSAEQQFDSGKLGIWLFLVTEVLFFSGLFVAYTLYRSNHPEIFEQAHVYLDKILGGLNTVVLLFSSLTMAMGVRSAQLGRNKNCAAYVLITMVCAAVFLGVKAVEYSHKWDMGIFVRSGFHLTNVHALPHTAIGQSLHISDYLVYISVIPALLLVGFVATSVIGKLMNKNHLATFMAGMAIMVGGYFLGAVGGQVYMKATEGGTGGSHASAQPLMLHASTTMQRGSLTNASGLALATGPAMIFQDQESSEKADAHQEADTAEPTDKTAGEEHAEHSDTQHSAAGHDETHADEHAGEHAGEHGPDPNAKLSRDVGIFFSIYYCMTGLHAIHIVGGIIALAWVFWRSLLGHWRNDYFGPVDYVGLYWHLVDLIWIYLFPLLYLID